MVTINYSKLIDLPKIEDPRGNLSIIEQLKQISFRIKRAYWIYDVPGGKIRGGHAYKKNEEFIVALSGSFEVELDDGNNIITYSLNRSYMGLYVPKGMWRTIRNFSTNSLALVLSSTEYSEDDYIVDYREFKEWVADNRDTVEEVSVVDDVTEYNFPDLSYMSVRSVFDCSIHELNKLHDKKGNLTYIYENIHVPFPINRVFYSYDIPGGEDRGAHAHKECHQFIIAATGSFEVVLDDGVNKRTVLLNRPFWGLHVPPGIWASEQGFSSGAICLVLASHGYSEDDYIRDYDDYLMYIKERITSNK